MKTVTRYEALRKVRSAFETEQAMADAFHVSQPTVWRWLNQSRQLPAQHVLLAEELTGVSRHLLRPDIYPFDPPSRWSGVDQRAGSRFVGRDNRARNGNRNSALDNTGVLR